MLNVSQFYWLNLSKPLLVSKMLPQSFKFVEYNFLLQYQLKFIKTYNTSWSIFYLLFTLNNYGYLKQLKQYIRGGFLKQRRLKQKILASKMPVLEYCVSSSLNSFWVWFFMHWFFMHWFFERLSFFISDLAFVLFTGSFCQFNFTPNLSSPFLDLIFFHYSGELASFFQNVSSFLKFHLFDTALGAFRYLYFFNIVKLRIEHK